jgi:uncharacterized protein (TIGR02611 family)
MADEHEQRAERATGAGVEQTGDVSPEPEVLEVEKEKPFGSKAPHFIKRSRTLHMTWQVGVLLVGVAIIAAGIAMLVLPGPGWVAIFAGLAVLGTEFAWAQRALIWSKDQAKRAASAALDPKVRRRNAIILAVGVLLIAGGVAIYIQKQGLPW